ncbi:methyltransferase domain-containing protein [Tabrizicola sp. M-4]|uniref:methyltransferase domain-containing protein n=1 Tax=Tabrizicola sp. M-4 TaxID=3055847 RepID=UPI003DA9652E
MAHKQQLEFVEIVRRHLPNYFDRSKVIEIGSMDINGSVRSFFKDCDYIGVDVADGRGVDLVGQGQLVEFESGTFDVAISCECFEHNPFWAETFANMLRMTRPGGIVIVSCAGIGRPEHGTTRTLPSNSAGTIGLGWDYYRNISTSDLRKAAALDWWFTDYVLEAEFGHCDTMLVGVTKTETGSQAPTLDAMRSEIRAMANPQATIGTMAKYIAASIGGDKAISALRRIAGK